MDLNLALGGFGLLTIVFLGGTMVWRPPLRPLSPWVQLALAAAALWGFGELWAASAESLTTKRIALTLLYSGSLFLPALWLITVFRWVGTHAPPLLRVDKSFQVIPLLFSAAFFVALLTQPWHGAVVEPVVNGRNEYGVAFPWMLLFGYLEVAVAIAMALAVVRTHPAPEVRRAGLLLAAAPVLPLVGNFAYVVTDVYEPSQLTGLALAVSCLVTTAAIWIGREFWLLPVALRKVVESDPSGVLILGPKGRPSYWNPAARQLLGDLVPTTDTELLPELAHRLRVVDAGGAPDAPSFAAMVATAGGRGIVCEKVAEPGEFLRVNLQPISRRGRPVASTLRIEDVSERLRAERARDALSAEAIETQKLQQLSAVAADLADGFHDHLASIVSAAFMASTDEERGNPVLDHLQRIARSADAALDLTQQLLAIAGRSTPDSATTSALALVEATIHYLEEDEHETLTIASYVPPALPLLRADTQQVVQGLVAIARAARGRMATGAAQLTLTSEVEELGPIEVAAYSPVRSPGHYVMISVVDEGRRMTDAERDRLLGHRAPGGASKDELELSAGVAHLVANGACLAVGYIPESGNLVRVAFPVETEIGP